jgi:hypothetical protein
MRREVMGGNWWEYVGRGEAENARATISREVSGGRFGHAAIGGRSEPRPYEETATEGRNPHPSRAAKTGRMRHPRGKVKNPTREYGTWGTRRSRLRTRERGGEMLLFALEAGDEKFHEAVGVYAYCYVYVWLDLGHAYRFPVIANLDVFVYRAVAIGDGLTAGEMAIGLDVHVQETRL